MVNNDNTSGKSPAPAYVSYVTLRNFLSGLAGHPLPSQINSSLMTTHSGATQSQLMTALRFFGLVDKDGHPQPQMSRVVDAAPDDDKWSSVAREVLLPRYERIVNGLDIRRATQAELDKAFRDGGAGSALAKAVRFYLKVLDDAKVEHSAHLRKTRRRAASGGSRRPRRRQQQQAQPVGDSGSPPQGMIDIPLYFKGRQQGLLRVPSDFGEKDNDVKVIEAAVSMATVYAQQEGGD